MTEIHLKFRKLNVPVARQIESHYKATMCKLRILSAFGNKQKSDFFRNPQNCSFSLKISAALDSTDKQLEHCMAQNFSKNRQLQNLQQNVWDPEQFRGTQEQRIIYVFSKLKLSRNPQL